MLLKRPNENERPSEFRVNIDRIKKIIKYYCETNIEYKKKIESGELHIDFEGFNKHVDETTQ